MTRKSSPAQYISWSQFSTIKFGGPLERDFWLNLKCFWLTVRGFRKSLLPVGGREPEHARGFPYPIWPGSARGFPGKSWKTFRLLCFDCCHWDLDPDKRQTMKAWWSIGYFSWMPFKLVETTLRKISLNLPHVTSRKTDRPDHETQ